MAQSVPTCEEGIPTIDGFRPAVLAVMSDGAARKVRDIREAAADYLGLTDEQRRKLIPTGQPIYRNRASWACSSFVKAGLLSRPSKGVYVITEDGKVVANRQLAKYSEADMCEWPMWQQYQSEIAQRRGHTSPSAQQISADQVNEDPQIRIDQLVRDVNAEVETELRQMLFDSSPEFFEKAVIELLWAMGYGGHSGTKEHLGKSGDGGVDGVIRQDPLGLQNVYVQAKRYAQTNPVGRGPIHEFAGVMASKAADRGVFITSSTFTKAALEAAKYMRSNIVLIDGIQLTSLMLAYGVGVEKSQTVTLYRVDQDFFAEE